MLFNDFCFIFAPYIAYNHSPTDILSHCIYAKLILFIFIFFPVFSINTFIAIGLNQLIFAYLAYHI